MSEEATGPVWLVCFLGGCCGEDLCAGPGAASFRGVAWGSPCGWFFGCSVWGVWGIAWGVVVWGCGRGGGCFDLWIVCASILYLWWSSVCGIRWMPWHQAPMKDVGGRDSPRGVVNQAVIRGCPNGGTQPELCRVAAV